MDILGWLFLIAPVVVVLYVVFFELPAFRRIEDEERDVSVDPPTRENVR
jgi:protein-S-isoprenylcysteine O-methyltransferase Ste14